MNLRWRDNEAHILNVSRSSLLPRLIVGGGSFCLYLCVAIVLNQYCYQYFQSGALTGERLKSPPLIPLGTALSSLQDYRPSMQWKLPLSFPLPFYKLWGICLSHVYVVLEWEHRNFMFWGVFLFLIRSKWLCDSSCWKEASNWWWQFSR